MPDQNEKFKVVGLRGNEVSHSKETCPETISRIEELLERAQSGEIKGIAAAFVFSDSDTGCVTSGFVNTAAALGQIELMKARILSQLVN